MLHNATSTLLTTCLCTLLCSAAIAAEIQVLESFDAKPIPKSVVAQGARLRTVKSPDGEGRVLEVSAKPCERAGFSLKPTDGTWDVGSQGGIAVDVHNLSKAPVVVALRVQAKTKNGKRRSLRTSLPVPAQEHRTVRLFLRNGGLGPYWGMRGVPEVGPMLLMAPGAGGEQEDPVVASSIGVHLSKPTQKTKVLIDNIRLFARDSELDALCPYPFVDKFGQYKHAEWPGKIHSEDEFEAFAKREDAELTAAPVLEGRDEFGGWADGPQLEATGWFRTEKIDGKWWLVTPSGHLFFSLGVNCINPGDATFVEGRESWFEWIPEEDGPFKKCIQKRGALKMGEPIGGQGESVHFHKVNQQRRFGDNWWDGFRDLSNRRLPAWGFNTIGNWSASQVMSHTKIPFVVQTSTRSGRVLAAGTGYWSKLVDVYDPQFPALVEKQIARTVKPFVNNPLVLGYFVDNELSWVSIPRAVMDSPVDQPARMFFIEELKAQYGTLEAFCAAWAIKAAAWDDVKFPTVLNDACRADADTFEYTFARKYFDTVAAVLRKHAPNQLYMGCRFTPSYSPAGVVKACAEVVDVVSTNAYYKTIARDYYSEVDKPVIIGEFHFGALDRGMFHTGLQGAADQDDCAAKYAAYVNSVADNPRFVGCHWFQYADQPLTGRTHDGENYSIGLVNVADVPYAELIDTAKKVHQNIYTRRFGK